MVNERDRRAGNVDRKTEDWLVGFRIGLALAEGGKEVLRRAGRIDVLDMEGKLIFSSRVDALPGMADAVANGAHREAS